MRPIAPGRRLATTVVAPTGMVGGAEAWLLAVLDATDRLEVDVVLLADGPLVSQLRERGIPVRLLPTGRSGVSVARTTVSLARHLRQRRPEVVMVNGIKAAAAGLPAAATVGVPSVWIKHDLSHDAVLGPLLGRLADRVIAVSTRAATAVQGRDVRVIEPGRPPPPATPGQARSFWSARGLHLQPDRRYVAMIGRVVPDKGIEDVVSALDRQGSDAWDLVVIGGDDPAAPAEPARLRQQVADLGLTDRVHRTGPVTDAGRWLSAFDAVAVVSRVTSRRHGGEGYSMVAIEAILAGVPLLATDAVPAAQGRTPSDRIVPQRDPDGIAAALASIADDTGGRRPEPDVVAGLQSWTHVADQTAAVLAEAAARPGAGLHQGPPVTVVSTVLNEGPAISQLLSSVTEQLQPDDQFVVVDGGSSDDTAARVTAASSRDPRITLVVRPGSGISEGRNAGRREAAHDVLVFTDAGCQPTAGWLDSLRLAFGEAVPPALVCGTYEPAADTPWLRAMAAACYPVWLEVVRRTPLVRLHTRFFGLSFDATMPTGRSSAVRAIALDGVGGFDETLATAEDVTMGRAIADLGGRCLLHAHALVRWEQRPGLPQQSRMWFSYGVGDGRSGDPLLIGRNLSRALVYVLLVRALRRRRTPTGSRRRRPALAGLPLLAYFSLPVARLLRRPGGMRSIPLIPAAHATKDLAKVAGCASGLLTNSADEPGIHVSAPRSGNDPTLVRPPLRPGVALLLPSIGLDGRSRVLATLVAMLNDHGLTPEVVTFSDPSAAHSLSEMAPGPLMLRVRRMRPPVWAKGALLQDLALSRCAAAYLPPQAGYVLLNTADVGFDPRSYVVRYVTFPPQRILEFEERYRTQPMRTFGRLAIAAYDRLAGTPQPGGAWLVNSRFIRDLVVQTHGIDGRDLAVAYGPVTIPATPPDGQRRREVVSVGGFHPDKRQLEQLEIASMLPDVAFTLIGSVRSARYLRACERVAAGMANVTVMVSPTSADLREALSGASVFLHTKHFEHQGLSTAEGIGHGCIPVVHDSGGQREVVPDPRLRFTTPVQAADIIRRALDGDFDESLSALTRRMRQFDDDAFRSVLAPYVDELLSRVEAQRRDDA